MSEMITRLAERRSAVVDEMQRIAETAQRFSRDLSSGEQTRFHDLSAEADALRERIDALEGGEQRARDIEASFARIGGNPGTGTQDRAFADSMREMLIDKNPRPVVVEPRTEGRMSVMRPGEEVRNRAAGIESRDLVTTSPASYRPQNVYPRIWEHATEASGVLAAGATVITTTDGGPLVLPKSTALSTAAIVSEASALGESDPTLSSTTLGSFKYGCLVQVSSEMLQDSSVDIENYLARETGLAIGTALGTDLVTGVGTTAPRGVALDATAGIAQTGTAAGWGTQTSANLGTDVVTNLVYALNAGYRASKSFGILTSPTNYAKLLNIKGATEGAPIGPGFVRDLGVPVHLDSNVASFSNGNKVAFAGAWDRYVVRVAGGIRFESDGGAFAWDKDLVTFRAVLRADAALINTDAVKKVTATT